jgi:hypothetical protein
LREAAAALLCFYQLNSVYLFYNIYGTLLVGCLCWQLGFGYGQVGDLKTLKLCDVVIGLDVLVMLSLF